MDESELLSQSVTVFAWSAKKDAVLRYPMEDHVYFLLTNFRHFSLSAAFSWSNGSSTFWN